MVFRPPQDAPVARSSFRSLAFVSLAVLSMQILFGGLTSANFAASACQTVPDCHGSWLPGKNLGAAFDITQAHRIGATGNVIGGAERADIQKLHRLTAVLTAALIIAVGIAAIRAGSRYRATAMLLLAIVLAEFTVGVAAILTELPIALAVAHNWLAAILLLSLIRLIATTRPRSELL